MHYHSSYKQKFQFFFQQHVSFHSDFFRSLEQRRDDVKTQQEQEKIGKNSAQNQSKFGSQLQPKSPITGKSNSFSTENISNNQRKKSSRKLDVYKENDEYVSDEEGYNISPSTSKSFFNNDYSAPNIFFDDFTYSDLDEEFIFNELKAIDELLAQSPNGKFLFAFLMLLGIYLASATCLKKFIPHLALVCLKYTTYLW